MKLVIKEAIPVIKSNKITIFYDYSFILIGWKNSWDEWVPESRVLKYNETNLAHQRQLKTVFFLKNPGETGAPKNALEKDELNINANSFKGHESKINIPEALKFR